MLNRSESALKLLCLGVAVLLVAQVARSLFRADPLGNLRIPEVPTFAGDSTNKPSGPGQTNATVVRNAGVPPAGSGGVSPPGSNGPSVTNAVSGTNASSSTNVVAGTNSASTNIVAGTNRTAATNLAAATNALAGKTNAPSTNAAIASARPGPGDIPPGMPGPMMMGGMPGMPGGPAKPLAPLVKARVDRIIDSELLAPVMRAVPMGLIGIAGQTAFLRATNGQTGQVKVGENVGGLRLVRIGFNRVLVEQGGQTNELTLFSGYGSESLLPKDSHK